MSRETRLHKSENMFGFEVIVETEMTAFLIPKTTRWLIVARKVSTMAIKEEIVDWYLSVEEEGDLSVKEERVLSVKAEGFSIKEDRGLSVDEERVLSVKEEGFSIQE
ncbi:unnamed protein product [Arabis nemorensis]|uniref:Uncharacterized protein n=1 Tax=Arabis nemorensis TaxID=586526 RepID=A0A565BF42_9BRAS|nr:unnamed protein product [Arabis nemorensis]